jgi:hypothetical protein
MTPALPIEVRPYRVGDASGLVGLFQQAFGRAITQDHWQWKLRGQASPVDNVWLAVAGDQPVFQYAGIPVRFSLSRITVTTMTSVDTMTAPQFRRRGLLTQVATRAYDAWREGGIAFVLGLPNEQWGSRAAALGWQPLFPLRWMVRPLRPQALLARRLKLPWLRRASMLSAAWNGWSNRRLRRDPTLQTESMQRADEAFDQIWQHCKADWMFSTVRDRHWINWRFLSAPSQTYEMIVARRAGNAVGYSAHRIVSTAQGTYGQLADLYVARADSAARDTLLAVLLETLHHANAESLYTLAVPGTAHYHWLRRAGFFPRHAFSVQMVPLSTQLPMELLRDPCQWNLSGADFDVI